MRYTLSVIIPVFNEAGNIRQTVEDVIKGIKANKFGEYEILIIDCLGKDGKDDGTAEIAEKLARSNPAIKAVHNNYINLGRKFWQGVSLAKMEYVAWIPGDGEITAQSIKDIFSHVGKTDIIIPFTENADIRQFKRRMLSSLFTFLVNNAFWLNIKYFNGPCVHKTKLLRALPERAKSNQSFSYMAEILVRLLKKGHSYKQVGMRLKERAYGKPKALSWENFFEVAKCMTVLFFELQIFRK